MKKQRNLVAFEAWMNKKKQGRPKQVWDKQQKTWIKSER